MRTAVGEIEVGVDIGIAYLAISVTLGYLGYKGWCDILFHWMCLAFGFFILNLRISEFSPKDSQRLDEQRAVVAAAAKREIRHGST